MRYRDAELEISSRKIYSGRVKFSTVNILGTVKKITWSVGTATQRWAVGTEKELRP